MEISNALRRLTIRGELSDDRAADVCTDFGDLAVTCYPHLPLSERIWQLRRNLSAYDATFVARAEALDVTLVTCDTHLARAPGHDAQIELFPAW